MGERIATIFPVLLAALLAGLTYWLDSVVQTPAAPRQNLISHHPDFIVEKLVATRMDVNGRVRDTLQAAQMMHYPDDDSAELESPRFSSYARVAPLAITSKQARITSNAGNIYFRDDVRASRAAQGGKSAMLVATDYLHLLPDDNIAKTDRWVTISDAHMTIEAVGMEMNSETRVLKLGSNVKGTFDARGTVAQKHRSVVNQKL